MSWLGVVIGAACLACLVIAFAFGPDAIAAGEHLEALGLPVRRCDGCAFCGLSRGFALFSDGAFRAGIDLNPAVLALYPAFWIAGVGGPVYALLHLQQIRRSSR